MSQIVNVTKQTSRLLPQITKQGKDFQENRQIVKFQYRLNNKNKTK